MSSLSQHVYSIDYQRMGVCVIINNEHLSGANVTKTRSGSGGDADAVTSRFKQLGFEVRRYDNVGGVEMVRRVEAVAEEDHSGRSCFALVLLTEGRATGSVCGADFVEVPLEDLLEPFKGNSCPGLIGKPKIFIIEAGRGEALDAGVEESDASRFSESVAAYKIPHEADIICAYSTVPGYVSWRSHAEGSWYIQTLCRVLEKHSDKPFLLLLDHVNHLVAHQKESKSAKYNGMKQMPQLVSQLTKTLYLAPPSALPGDGF